MRFTKTIAGLIAAAAMAATSPAFADSMTFASSDIGKTVTLGYNGYTGTDSTASISGLTGSTTFTLTGVSGNDYTFDYSVANTTSAPVADSRISSFAFDTDPSIASASSTGAYSYTTLNSNYPNGIGTVDVCFKDAATGACAGGGSGGLTAGQTGTGTFTLSFSTAPSALTLSNFFVRYQSIVGVNGVSSASGAGTISSTSSTTGGTPVPEPGMLGLFGAGAIALAFARRRKPTLAAA
ncbi:cistern family PEP-CTERM protein [Novosphingobium cyanobacteriorum]|uniref:Cistern family PEP-CTERM protein n=1 Tax=Novosphingobium cyanobacteriorum TaxID=3024215 RepID=A0ABT6CRZ7_9SPHN|nr:cistern family PEP-CTERM protein [Novosphingobium cyanobacteriorum]MDF8335432.1 cistern family PEP-CTERM protein [Novosphingobium cyanobacteriorum]